MDKELQKILHKILARLSSQHPSMYYMSTSEVAGAITQMAQEGEGLSEEEREKLKNLTQERIQYLLSFDDEDPAHS